jgi:hypothetical protein
MNDYLTIAVIMVAFVLACAWVSITERRERRRRNTEIRKRLEEYPIEEPYLSVKEAHQAFWGNFRREK